MGFGISMVIVAYNTVLRMIIIALITWVAEDTYSARLAEITNGVFVATFFNTAIVLLLVNANLTEHAPHFLTEALAGQWYDYVPGWYSTVGYSIVFTMVINCFMPFVSVGTAWGLPFLLRFLDVGFSGDPYKTKKTQMAQFKKAWSQQDYFIHYKFSGALNVYYVTLMYGVGLPILFPLAALNFFNQWVCERIVVAYLVKQPPALDDKLIKNCIGMLKWAPFLYICNGFWMLSNSQIFLNKWSFKRRSYEEMKSQHFLTFHLSHSSPLLLMVFASFLLILLKNLFGDQLRKMGFAMEEKRIEVDEDLPNFFTAIKLSEADKVILEE